MPAAIPTASPIRSRIFPRFLKRQVISLSAATVKSAPCSPERVLVLFGSPHAEGPTARLTAAALASLPHGTHTLIWNCFETPVLPCDDCGYCRHRAGCSKRDLDGFYAELEEADRLLFATPVYHRSFPAPMKAVLDRLQRYWSARFVLGLRPPIAKPKRGILLTVSGSPSDEGGRLIEQQLAPHLTVLNTTLAGTVHYVDADAGAPLDDAAKALCALLAGG